MMLEYACISAETFILNLKNMYLIISSIANNLLKFNLCLIYMYSVYIYGLANAAK